MIEKIQEEELKEWLKKQEEKEPNENVLKIFKWYLMQIEEDVNNEIYNHSHAESLDKYGKKIMDRKIMKEENVLKYIRQALGFE